jgi:hypothetical protein
VNVAISVWHPKDLEQSSREQLSLINFDTHLTARPVVVGPFGEETPGRKPCCALRYLLPLAALISGAPSRGETIIDEWQNVKAPPPPQLQSVTLDPKTTALLMIDIIKQTATWKGGHAASQHRFVNLFGAQFTRSYSLTKALAPFTARV